MRWMMVMTPVLLAGCTTVSAEPAPPPAPAPEAECKGDALAQFVGQTVDAELGARMLAASGARTLRWVAPGMAVTMDFRADRLTVQYDKDRKVTTASCG